MKISGVVKISGIQIQEKLQDKIPVSVDGIEIEYNAEFTVAEAVQMLDLPEKALDVLAACARKFNQYDAEFEAERKAKAQSEVSNVLEDIKEQDDKEKQTA